MRRTALISVTLLAGLALAGCSDSTPSEPPATGAATATSAEGTDSAVTATCAGFFESTGTPLAERAAAARSALTAGEITDDVSYAEVNVLEQRIRGLGEETPPELAEHLEAVNAPFAEAVDTVNAFRAQEVPEGEEAPAFADLTGIDVSGSESAQADVEAACAESGYEVPAA